MTLNPSEFARGLAHLANADADLKQILVQFGNPPMWSRPPGFPTLIYIILEQQVSLASARIAFERLKAAIEPLTPATFLTLDDLKLKEIGFSRQKIGYCRELARLILDGRLDLEALKDKKDSEVRETMLKIRGVGSWTSEIYLLMALNRSDAWPDGDLAIRKSVQQVKRLDEIPTSEVLDEISRPWQPWRAVAARLLWHHYLSSRKYKT